MKNVAILYIGIGNYAVLWNEFYNSSEKYLLRNYKLEYFLFSDTEFQNLPKNVHFIKEKNKGWPYNTLLRFEIFLKIKEKLQNFDYIIFFNANALFITEINEIILPTENEEFVLAKHFKTINIHKTFYMYDRNKNSNAYVKYGNEGQFYIQACFISGHKNSFLKMSNTLTEKIRDDLNNNIIAKWHDESHLNKYIIDKKVRYLNYNYIYPESIKLPLKPLIVMRNKEKYMPLNKIRNIKSSFFIKFKNKLFNQFDKIRDYFYYIILTRKR